MARRILLVDDEPEMLILLELTLSIAGYEIAKTDKGTKTCDLIAEFDPHIVILDLMMPDLSGIEVLRGIKQRFANPPEVIILSARTGFSDIVAGREAGAFTYIFKPVTRGKLLDAIESAMIYRSQQEQNGK
ncbi:MAG: response regulator [Chloroflexi bacterium]|nr:response regulator [Chloroflexota bacterium]